MVAIVAIEIGIQQFVVARNGATDARGVSGEDGAHFGAVVLQEQHAETWHPFVSLINDAFSRIGLLSDDFCYFTCCIGEHGGFVVVTIGVERIHLEKFPCTTINLVFLREEGLEIYEDGERLSGDVPTSDADGEPNILKTFLPVFVDFFVFDEERVVFSTLTEIWSDENKVILKLLLERLGASWEYGVDATDFVADFPARFEDYVGKCCCLIHDGIYIVCCKYTDSTCT